MSASEDLPLALSSSMSTSTDVTDNLDININNTTIMEVKSDTWRIANNKTFSCYSMKIRTGNAPATASTTGTTGDIRWDAGYLYVCVATDTWKRISLSWTSGYAQVGNILLGSGYVATANLYFGRSVSISRDGTTAAIGATGDNSNKGAVWIYIKSGSDWIPQGSKLTPLGTSSTSVYLGSSVALSANGNVVAIGATWHQAGLPGNSDRTGGVWIYKRTGTTWTYATTLVPVDNIGGCQMGTSVAIDDSGTTVACGGPIDNNNNGAVWVFKDDSGWTVQATLKNTLLAGAQYGDGLAFSGDGNILCVGGPNYTNSYTGTIWTYSRTAGTWSERDEPFAPPDSGQGLTGDRISLSQDGSTLAIGSSNDNFQPGSVFVYTYSEGWNSEQKIVPDDNIGDAAFGVSLSLSTDGNTLAVGGNSDNTNVGAVWVYTRSGTTWTKLNKYITSDHTETPRVGNSISMSGDASTILAGGFIDSGAFSNAGGAWFFGA